MRETKIIDGWDMAEPNITRFATLHELVKAAQLNLGKNYWDYLIGGTETETTILRNRLALDSLAFRPRVLNNISEIDTSTSFWGHDMTIPVMLAPIGALEVFEEGGGATTAKAAETFGVIDILSSVCNPTLEEVAKAGTGPKMFQLYIRGDDAWFDDHVRRAIDNGYIALVLTVDTAIYSRRERDIAKRFNAHAKRHATGGMDMQGYMDWDLVKKIKDTYDIPLVLKGIGTAEDATLAVEHGVDLVYVSNHGGRQLDHSLGSMDVLPEVVEAVAGKTKIAVDGGIVRGTDILKAIALGADLVGIGRLKGYAMAAGGYDALINMLNILQVEMHLAMGLMGVTSLDQLNPNFIAKAPPVVPPHVTSAFPHLDLDSEGY